MQEAQIRAALSLNWQASANGDTNTEHEIYDDNVICDYPQSGERILGRKNLQALRSHHPGKPSGFNIRRMAAMLRHPLAKWMRAHADVVTPLRHAARGAGGRSPKG